MTLALSYGPWLPTHTANLPAQSSQHRHKIKANACLKCGELRQLSRGPSRIQFFPDLDHVSANIPSGSDGARPGDNRRLLYGVAFRQIEVVESEARLQVPENIIGTKEPLSPPLTKRVDDLRTGREDLTEEALRVRAAHLHEKGLKQSAKRDRVLDVFLATRDHLSAEELHRLVRKRDPSIGYATVHRTLKLLAQCGLAYEVEFHDGVTRYELSLNRRTHHHMVCTICGESIEFFVPELEDVERRIGQQFRFQPSRHAFQIFGTCASCLKEMPPHART
jgi:Fur family ferric uptake transcriptional regulator